MQQKHLFYNEETGDFALWTMDLVQENGSPIDSDTGEDLDYVGPVIAEFPKGGFLVQDSTNPNLLWLWNHEGQGFRLNIIKPTVIDSLSREMA